MKYIETALENMINGLTPLREKLIKRREVRERKAAKKRFIKNNPEFGGYTSERWHVNEKQGLTDLIYRAINDPNGSYILTEYMLFYRGKDDSATFWVSENNYPYSYGHIYYRPFENDQKYEKKIGIDVTKYREFNSTYAKPSMQAVKDLHDFCASIEKMSSQPRTISGGIIHKRQISYTENVWDDVGFF